MAEERHLNAAVIALIGEHGERAAVARMADQLPGGLRIFRIEPAG